MPAGKQAVPEHCSARKAVKFYAGRIAYWRDKMGAAVRPKIVLSGRCPRYLAHVLQRKAYAAQRAYYRWVEYHWYWWKWMPVKLQRVGACETGYGKRPGNFHWDSGLYVSFAGIIRDGYATFAHRLGLRSWDETRRELRRDPTPREQVLVTLALQEEYGWGAWGCGGA
jgi:hypothetical protein